ncbi:TonB-dependent receptor [Mucilaginibacter sp. Bleaf8]|uniref:outer membrane beta-barrel family protein n=1 Tax=Mucilaginibacter sp. Bleaf8 TaxID=2834430 RepID=UPI001BCB8E5B|nr:outer membrane beta-barrel family protein [Mucilaginibacter sp. Bleaf8]MBS7565933.1 TonB-dependent receptor [Mucilaginibacter sp. Bleaf8]
MNFRVYTKLLFALLFLTAVNAVAQSPAGNGTISGKLIDAATSKPLDFASVSLVNKADNKPVKGMQTDLDGNFKLTNISNGYYLLRISFVGYLTYMKDSIRISDNKSTIQLGTVKMRASKSSLLKEVVISGQKSQIKLSTDKKVFSVDQSLVSQGGSATDLLGNVPSIQVDVEGNVSLRGSSNVRVLVNGKPSAISGGSVSDILQSIPASAIENIEVITNPSSKYDAEGQSGIINIILKKNAQVGFNGSASASVGNQNSLNGNLNLAYQTGKVNVFTNYSYRRANRIGNGSNSRITYPGTDSASYQDQISNQTFKFNSHNIRAGIDYNLDPKTVVSLSGNLNVRSRDRFQDGSTNIRPLGVLSQTVGQNNQSYNDGNNLDVNADFSHKFKKQGEELTANVGYSSEKENSTDNLKTTYSFLTDNRSRVFEQNNYTNGKQRNWNLQADYTLPLSKTSKLEAGYRSTFNNNNNDYRVDTLASSGVYTRNNMQSNIFNYQEQVHALYTNYQRQFGDFGVQVGLRLEDAHIRTRLTDTAQVQRFKQDYLRVYPSVFLTDKLTENQTLQLSYTRRVSRPRDRQLSPFLDRSDPLNFQQGNPSLLPEDTHSFELSYINYWKALTLTSSVYYRLTNDNIQQVRLALDSVTTLTQFQNIKNASNAGYELIAKLSPSQLWDITANVNVYYRNINGDPSVGVQSTSGYAFNGNLTANIKPVKKLGIQLRGDYQGKQVIAQGYSKPMYGLDGGLRYDITKTLNASMNVRDVFNTRKFGSIINNTNQRIPYTSVSERRFATRAILFTLSYRFGGSSEPKRQRKGSQQDQNGSPDDMGGGQGGPNVRM